MPVAADVCLQGEAPHHRYAAISKAVRTHSLDTFGMDGPTPK